MQEDAKQIAQRALECLSAGLFQETCDFLVELCRLDPRNAWGWMTLGAVRVRLGQTEEAQTCLRRALELQPAYPEAHYNLADVLRLKGGLQEALRHTSRAIDLAPGFAHAWILQSWLHLQLNDLVAAETEVQRVLSLQPGMPEAHYALGNLRQRRGQGDEALSAYRRAVELNPRYADAHFQAGNVQAARGALEEAAASFSRACEINPGFHAAQRALAVALRRLGRPRKAVEAYRRALALDPRDAPLWTDLGYALALCAEYDESEDALRRALSLDASQAGCYTNLGMTLNAQGRVPEAVACYRRALELKPDYAHAHSNLLLSMNYLLECDPAEVLREHQEWGRIHGLAPRSRHRNDPDPRRRLRIGYVSADFRRHPVACFIEGLLACRDASRFEIVCYAEVPRPDAVTQRMRGYADLWRETCGKTDEQVVEQVVADGIDILVDLGGHTASNRLRVFTARPAPVQVSYIGYANTSGLSTIDYRITDRTTDPPGAEAYYTEKLLYIDGGFSCYTPPQAAPAISPLPALARGFVTFGAMPNVCKINEAVIDLWCDVLRAIPSARMLVFRDALKGRTRQELYEAFGRRGIGRDRVTLAGEMPERFCQLPVGIRHLGIYEDIDVMLDTLPWNGHTISCESLWMGAPVLTLMGDRHCGRIGASILGQVGLADLAAGSPDGFVDIAVRMAADLQGLDSLRQALRERMRSSPLCDAANFARKIEACYRTSWRNWCAAQEVDAHRDDN